MPFKSDEVRREYLKTYKAKKRRELGIPTKKEAAVLRSKKQRESLTEDILLERKQKISNYNRQWSKDNYARNKLTHMYNSAKQRARKAGLEFSIDKNDIVIPTHCPYLGIELVPTRSRKESKIDIASLDRIDNTKGYIKGNIEVVSWLANTMKNNATPELLVSFAKEVLRRYENNGM